MAHGALDVATLGLWELIGTPLEMGAGREKRSRVIIQYNEDDEILNVQSVGGGTTHETTSGDL